MDITVRPEGPRPRLAYFRGTFSLVVISILWLAVLFLSVAHIRQRKSLSILAQSLEASHQSERLLRTMIDSTPDLTSLMDRQRRNEMELKRTEEDLRRKDRLLMAVAVGTLELIRNDNLEAAAGKVIKLLGIRMDLDRVNIYCNKTERGKVVFIDQLAAWDRSSDEVEYRYPSMQQIPAATMPFVTAVLSKNEIYCGNVGELEDEGLQTLLAGRAVRSLASIPIFAGGHFWGFMTFNDYGKRRQWTEAEFSILRSFGATLGAVIERKQVEQQRIRAKEDAEGANSGSV